MRPSFGPSEARKSHAQSRRNRLNRSSMTPKAFFRWVAWLLIFAIAVFTLSPIEMRPVSGGSVSLERVAAFAAVGAAFLGYPKHGLGVLILLIGIVSCLG